MLAIDFQPPIIYTPLLTGSVFTTQQTNYFDPITLFDTRGGFLVNKLEFNGVTFSNKNDIKNFFDSHEFLFDIFDPLMSKIEEEFRTNYTIKLDLDTSEKIGGSELFVIIKTNNSAEETINKLDNIDKWFVPNVYSKFQGLNINVDF
jgi:hypothetical protein